MQIVKIRKVMVTTFMRFKFSKMFFIGWNLQWLRLLIGS